MFSWTFPVSSSLKTAKIMKNKSRPYLKKICSLVNHDETSFSVRFRELHFLKVNVRRKFKIPTKMMIYKYILNTYKSIFTDWKDTNVKSSTSSKSAKTFDQWHHADAKLLWNMVENLLCKVAVDIIYENCLIESLFQTAYV